MAVQAVVTATRLRIKYLGDIVNEKQTFITKTYSNINPHVDDQDIYDVFEIISDLQTKTVYSVSKSADTELMEA
ncbi:MAG: DUF1659 domain-containing protein [Firmicutes bacterium]|nr:DUF1659 domain-containing protein [Bacillota bacterium]